MANLFLFWCQNANNIHQFFIQRTFLLNVQYVAPYHFMAPGDSEWRHNLHHLGKELVAPLDFTLIAAIFLDFILLVIFVFSTFYSIHSSGVLSNYLGSRLKVMVIFDSSFRFSYFVGFILIFTTILIRTNLVSPYK